MKKITCLPLLLAVLLPLTFTAAQSWELQNPLPTVDNLRDVDFLDPQNGWAVGLLGDLLHTTDGGETWSVQRIDSGHYWYALDFADADHGFVVGSGYTQFSGVIARTTDGGATWQIQQTPAPQSTPQLVTCLNADTAWVACAYGVILRTVDGGLSWQSQREPSNEVLQCLTFVNADSGWASGTDNITGEGVLLRTTNGGATWLALDSAADVSNRVVQFLDAATGFRVRMHWTEWPYYSQLLKTTDGGASWAVATDSVGRSIYALAFADTFTGWAIDEGDRVLRTTDGGLTWIDLPLPAMNLTISNPLQALHVLSATEAWVAGYAGTLLHTTDGGASWLSATRGCTDAIQGLCFIDSLEGWAVARSEVYNHPRLTILHTTDGGNAWSTQLTDTAFSGAYGIDFVSPLCGWAVGSNYEGAPILHTTDGGQSWLPQPAAEGYYLSGVDFINETTGWAVGADSWYNSATLRTTDGGLHWSRYDIVLGDGLYGVSFVDERHGWAWGGYNTLQHTSDGGASWHLQGELGGGALRGGCFLDSLTGWIVGDDGDYRGCILRTTDGGEHWLHQDTSFYVNSLEDVYFADAQNGWVVSEYGSIARTTDGGVTWRYDYSTVSWLGLNAITGVGPQLWAAGEHGVVLHQSAVIASAPQPRATATRPRDYALAAYPNPFNPTTTLDLALPASGEVTLAVYDLTGRLVATLWQGRLEAGRHTLRFDGSALASGIYFARVSTPAFSTTQRLLLLK